MQFHAMGVGKEELEVGRCGRPVSPSGDGGGEGGGQGAQADHQRRRSSR